MQNLKPIGELLYSLGIVSREQIDLALKKQAETGTKLGKVLVEQGILTEQELIETLEFTLGIPHVKLSKINIDVEAINLIPSHLIRQHQILPVAKRDKSITLAMADPLNQQAIDDVRMASGLDVIPVLAGESDIDNAIRQYLAFRVDPALEKILGELSNDIKKSIPNMTTRDSIRIDDDAPIVKITNSLLTQAVQGKCSDIHVEPQENDTRVRFRVDGDLFAVLTIPKASSPALVSRLKIMAGMDIAEKRIPQDGRFNMVIDNRPVDFRVSTLPTIAGEKVVLRILDQANAITNIDKLGLSDVNRELLLSLAYRPHGLVLAVGPTGSGKTTTLYSILKEINSINKNIITLEDPIEYSLPGINQVQINPKTGLTFASGLRSILRQDPDIIMVGEIRDLETARLAVQASLTGHLVFSTLHTNGAAATIARLVDMGVEKYLLSSALMGVISQRLVRRLCLNCRQAYLLDERTAYRLDIPEETGQTFYQSTGCNTCRQLGYQGRLALHEILYLDQNMRNLISTKDHSEEAITKVALDTGMVTLKMDGVNKAKQGLTSLEEVMKTVLLGE